MDTPAASLAILAVLFLSTPVLAQPGPSLEATAGIVSALDERVTAIVPGPVLQTAKATYLEGYGLVVTIGVALDLPQNLFTRLRPAEEIRRSSDARRQALKETAIDVLREYVPGISGLGLDDRIAIIVYMLNTNPADLPDVPTQFVASLGKRDASDVSESSLAERVVIREY